MKKISILLACLSLYSVSMAQQETEPSRIAKVEQKMQEQEEALTLLKKLKVTGYVQTQWQHGEKDAALKVGAKNEQKEDTFDRTEYVAVASSLHTTPGLPLQYFSSILRKRVSGSRMPMSISKILG